MDWYRLLTAHARAAGAHLMLSKKFLFKPQQQRDDAGLGDRPLVSNRAGTTGMNETVPGAADPGPTGACAGAAARRPYAAKRRKSEPKRVYGPILKRPHPVSVALVG